MQAAERMIDREKLPNEKEIAKWIGAENYKRWQVIITFIDGNYEGVFKKDDWIFGGKKYGWALRFKKSKSFCSLIPERGRFLLLIVFGAEERAKMRPLLNELSPVVREKYINAKTYHDGKWLVLEVNNNSVIEDVKKMFLIKRKPKLN